MSSEPPAIAVSEATTGAWTFVQDVEAYARTGGVTGIGVVREKLAGLDVTQAARRVRDAGLGVSTLSYAGMFTRDVARGIEDGRRAIDQARQLGAAALGVLAGPRLGVDLLDGAQRTRAGLEALAPDAVVAGIELVLEAFHPMDVTRWSTVVTLAQALDLTDGLRGAGILLNTWHTWWDPEVDAGINRASGGLIRAVQVADWQDPPAGGNPRNQAVPGDGLAPLTALLGHVHDVGYRGWYEVQVSNDTIGAAQYDDLLRRCVEGMRRVLPS